jgi:hypothetical protein
VVSIFIREFNFCREIGWGGMDWIHLAQDRDQWTRYWTFGFHKIEGSLVERLAASEEELSFMELAS